MKRESGFCSMRKNSHGCFHGKSRRAKISSFVVIGHANLPALATA